MLIWSSSWSGRRVSLPLRPVFIGRLKQTPDLGPHRRLPLVCTQWWCELWWGYKAVGGWGSGFGLWKRLCWSWSGCLAEGPSVYMEGCTPGPAATVWAHCVVEAKQIAYLHWINTGTKKALTGAKGPAACLSAPVTLILIVTIIPRGAASIDNWQRKRSEDETETSLLSSHPQIKWEAYYHAWRRWREVPVWRLWIPP